MPENHFDARIARDYDVRFADTLAPAVVTPAVDFLVRLTGQGAALEFGLGTGRVALPLHARGVRVQGIELSPEMFAEFEKKPGAQDIAVAIGDFATTTVEGSFDTVYLVRNTIMNLITQDSQVACFQNAASHLRPGGFFVIEVMIPELQRLPPGEVFRVFDATLSHVGIEEYDVATQIAYSHHHWMSDGRYESFSAPFRYVWPSELDLMARLADMSLVERWSTWSCEPFTSESRGHVSVWQKSS